MAMIEPRSQDERRADESQFPTGMYLVQLKEVREVGPSARFPNGNNRLVFDFEVADGPFKGKRSASFVGKTIFRDTKSGKESNLVKLARSMGVSKPENGFDPDTLVGKFFNAMCEQDTSSPDGRTWVRAVTPAGSTTGGQPAAEPIAPVRSGPPPRKPAAPAEPKFWVPMGDETPLLTAAEIKIAIEQSRLSLDGDICPEGGEEYKPVCEYLPEMKQVIPF